MKVKLLTSRAGPRINQRFGQEIEVGEVEAERLLSSAQAEPVCDASKKLAAKLDEAYAKELAEKAAATGAEGNDTPPKVEKATKPATPKETASKKGG